MIKLLALAVILAGCGESSVAGGVGGGSGAASSGGNTGAGGAAGAAGSSIQPDAGSDAGPQATCNIPLAQISGTFSAVYNSANSSMLPSNGCQSMTTSVQIIQGAYYNAHWTFTNYTVSPTTADPTPTGCAIAISFQGQSPSCGVESLYVHATVPPIPL